MIKYNLLAQPPLPEKLFGTSKKTMTKQFVFTELNFHIHWTIHTLREKLSLIRHIKKERYEDSDISFLDEDSRFGPGR